jgi:predicted O-linked N-acetylglucosamine transferase (SPINDLY family)
VSAGTGGREPDFISTVLESIDAGRFDRAAALCDMAGLKAPGQPALAYLRGALVLARDGPAAALPFLEKAAADEPGSAALHALLGEALHRLGDHVRAVPAFARALEIAPGSAAIRVDFGAALNGAGRPDDAIGAFERALTDDPANELGRLNLAKLLADLGRADDAVPHLETLAAQTGDGAYRVAHAAWRLPVIARSAEDQRRRWAEYETAVAALERAGAPIDISRLPEMRPNFVAAYQGRDDRRNQERIAAYYRRNCPALTFRASHLGGKRRGRPRVGFVSMNFRNHTVGKLYRGVIRHLDRARFEVTVFAGQVPSDDVGRAIRDSADHFAVLPRDLRRAQTAVAEAAPDILFYADIGMDPLTYFLAFARLAPVQCVGWGHGVTTGIDTIDQFVSSRLMETESGPDHYSERLVRLDPLPVYLDPPGAPDAPRADLGGGTCYLCVQSLFKLHPDFDAMLDGILRADPNGTIVMIAHRVPWVELLRARWRESYPALAERVRFVPRQRHPAFLGLLQAADVVLDTPYFSGGLSSAEAFAMAKAVVTLPDDRMPSRVTLGYYRQMEVAGAVAANAGDYVETAVALANDGSRRAELEARIRGGRARLFARADAVRALEDHFEASLAQIES